MIPFLLVLGRVRAAISGPLGQMMAVASVALVVITVLGAGLGWLRRDAARDAQVKCDADKLALELAHESMRRTAVEKALAEREASLMAAKAAWEQSESLVARLELDMETLRNEAAKQDAAAGRAGVCLRADDPWLRRGQTGAAASGVAPRR